MAKKKAARPKKKANRKTAPKKSKPARAVKKAVRKTKPARPKPATGKKPIPARKPISPKKPVKPRYPENPDGPPHRLMSIQHPFQNTDVVRVVGDQYYICPDCDGDAPEKFVGDSNVRPVEGYTRIIYPPVSPASLSPVPDEINDEQVQFNAAHDFWYQHHRPLTTAHTGSVHQFVIWFKYQPASGMGGYEYSLPDSKTFTPRVVPQCP